MLWDLLCPHMIQGPDGRLCFGVSSVLTRFRVRTARGTFGPFLSSYDLGAGLLRSVSAYWFRGKTAVRSRKTEVDDFEAGWD